MTYAEWIDPAWAQRFAEIGVSSLALLLDESPEQSAAGVWTSLHKSGLGGRQRWRWEAPGGMAMFVKKYARTPLREQLDRMQKQAARHSRAYWEHFVSGELAAAQVPAVAAIAYCERMQRGWEQRSLVVFESAIGEPADRIWQRLSIARAPITRGAKRHDVVARMARFVSAFHQTGYFHRDLYLCHIFAELDPRACSAPRFCLIDLARVHKPRARRMRWLLKDLSQLDFSARNVGATRTDRLRFLLAYLGLQRGAPRVRWYIRRIVRRSDAIMNRDARKRARALVAS